MPKRKKVKGKTRTKRKKTRSAKMTARRKSAAVRKKSAKKTPVRRASPKKARPGAGEPIKARRVSPPGKSVAAAPTPSLPKPPMTPEKRIGIVTHYYSHLSVAILRLESGMLRIGDMIHIRGHTTDFSQRVDSLEIDHAPATEVGPNDDFGLKVIGHVREHDVVYKVLP